MSSKIGMNPYQGLYTVAQFLQGKIPTPGGCGQVTEAGITKEYISVKLGAATWINGMAVTIDGDGAATLGTAQPSLLFGGRVGILVLASATATLTAAATAYAWAQIYGKALALTTASVTSVGGVLTMGADGRLIGVIAAQSASSQLDGITALATQAASGLLSVLLQYPRFTGLPA
jgi:hypothetical protein